jgi:RNA polymerase sigma-70 factor, ECF subfamily
MDDQLLDPELLSEAWNQLHPLHRELIRKAHHLGWTTGEIAADLNVAEPLVKSQLHDALHAMRLSLTDPSPRSRKTFKPNSSGRIR